jgi:hypothetical protein
MNKICIFLIIFQNIHVKLIVRTVSKPRPSEGVVPNCLLSV